MPYFSDCELSHPLLDRASQAEDIQHMLFAVEPVPEEEGAEGGDYYSPSTLEERGAQRAKRYHALPACLQPYGFHIAWSVLVLVLALNIGAITIQVNGVVRH